MARLRGTTFRQHEYPGGRHEVFNELNKDDVLADVTAFIDDAMRDDCCERPRQSDGRLAYR